MEVILMGKFNEDSKIRDVLADPQALELIEKYFPGAIKHPMIPLAKGMKISVMKKFRKQAGLTLEQCESFLKELSELE